MDKVFSGASIRQGLVMRSQLTFHCSLQQPRRKRTNLSILIYSSSSFIPPSMVKRRKVISTRSYFTPSIYLLLLLPLPYLLLAIAFSTATPSSPFHVSFSPSILLSLSVTRPLSPFSLSLPLFFSFPLSWCKVMEAGVCGSWRARLRDYTARLHERFMMLGSVCVCVC